MDPGDRAGPAGRGDQADQGDRAGPADLVARVDLDRVSYATGVKRRGETLLARKDGSR